MTNDQRKAACTASLSTAGLEVAEEKVIDWVRPEQDKAAIKLLIERGLTQLPSSATPRNHQWLAAVYRSLAQTSERFLNFLAGTKTQLETLPSRQAGLPIRERATEAKQFDPERNRGLGTRGD